MVEIRINGDAPNLRIMLDNLNGDPGFREGATVSITSAEYDEFSLGNAHVATLVIDLSVGLASSATYDLLKAAVAAARRRGVVSVEGMEQVETPSESTENPEV